MSDAISDQRELFALLDEFFRRATGKTPETFAPLDGFNEAVKTLKPRLHLVSESFAWGIPKLHELYSRLRSSLFSAAGAQGGLKVVLGGSSRFGKTQLKCVRSLILYTDTVLIPDPVLAFIETERQEERFPHVQILEAIFYLLRLKPLVDSDCAYPPVIVFPSFERTLAQRDPATRAEMEQFYVDIYSPLFEQSFSSAWDIVEYSKTDGAAFLDTVARKKLFVGPGGPVDEPLEAAIDRYRKEIRMYRSADHIAQLEGLSEAMFVGNAIMERLEPQFHLIQNATELRAQPLMAIEQQAYYFKLIASVKEDVLEKEQVISPATRATIDALSRQRFSWLSNVDMDALVEMRMNNENEEFRERLSKNTSLLAEAGLADMDRVSAEVTRSIGSILNEHRVAAEELEARYKPKYSSMAVRGWMSAAGLLIPHLSPLFPVAPAVILAGQYVQTKSEERRHRKKLAHSLIGILASATVDDPE
jgi:hypothetical protein